MKVGVELLLADNGWLGRAPRYAEVRALARQAEAAGFDALWCYDHLLYRAEPHPAEGVWEGWTVLSALAEATTTIGLGSLVSCTGFRNPALQANMATTLDEVSAGRFTLGLGAGWNEAEMAAYGFAVDHRVARFEEAVEIIAGLLRGDEVTYDGRYHHTERCVLLPRGPSPDGPALLVAAMGPRMLRAAARWGDAWNGGYAATPDDVVPMREALARACDEVGRDPATLALTAEVKVGYPDLWPPPVLFEDRYATGSADQVAATLHAFADAGFAEVMCTCSPNTPEALDRVAEALAAYRAGRPEPAARPPAEVGPRPRVGAEPAADRMSGEPMRITLLGHASVLIEHADDRVLVDPVFADGFASGAIDFHPARDIDVDALPPPTALCLTHHHIDHWHAPTVAAFDRSTPVLVPDDPWLVGRLRALGFTELVVLSAWTPVAVGGLELWPTPSDTDVDEYGFVARAGDASYWHMSDCYARLADAAAIVERVGAVDVVAARYQAGNALVSYQRGLGSSHDERDAVAEWLEAACRVSPSLVFPYFWGVAYRGDHGWANRYAAPLGAGQVARVLRRRLSTDAEVAVLDPGDVIEVGGPSRAEVRRAASPVVRRRASAVDGAGAGAGSYTDPPDRWAPVDVATLAGIDEGDERELVTRLEAWLQERFGPWLVAGASDAGHPVAQLVAWRVRWQAVVHLGEGRTVAYRLDLGAPAPQLAAGRDPDADLAVHLSGRALLDVLRGDAGTDLFWMAGAARVCERILLVDGGRVAAPPVQGWGLHEAVPEPLTWCLRLDERDRLAAGP